MNPFYFGASDKRLFGVFHPASSPPPRRTGVVICNATYRESLLSHRAIRHLATTLARRKVHVLRFDYYASGDSAGSSDEATIEQWKRDVLTAVDELKDTAGVARVSLVGLRLGATLAALVAAQRSCIERVVLWDPIVHGQQYLDELTEKHQKLLAELWRRPTKQVDSEDGLYGFPMTQNMRRELSALHLPEVLESLHDRMFLVSSGRSATYTEFEQHFSAQGVPLPHQQFSNQEIWEERELDSNELVPAGIIEHIVSCLCSP